MDFQHLIETVGSYMDAAGVAVTPTFESVGVLAIIVAIRTFLSFSLELEITGRWPWQKEPGPAGNA